MADIWKAQQQAASATAFQVIFQAANKIKELKKTNKHG